MKRLGVYSLPIVAFLFFIAAAAIGSDATLSKHSTLEGVFSRGELRVGFNAGYMPFQMVSKRTGQRERQLRVGDERRPGQTGLFIGFDIDIAREMAKELGVRFIPVNTKWPSIIPALHAGRFDIIISGMSVTEARKQRVDFAEPYMVIGQTILLAKKHKDAVKSYEDLNKDKYIVASNPATTGEEAVKRLIPNAVYRPYGSEVAGANAVLLEQVDAFVYDFPFNAVFFDMYGKDRLVFLDKPFTVEPLAWAIRKNDPDFLKFLNKFMQDIKSDGRYDRIYDKWFKHTDWYARVR